MAGRRFAIDYAKLLAGGLLAFLVFIQLPFLMVRGYVDPFNTFSRFGGQYEGRQYLWSQALEMINANLLLGIGPQHYGPTLQTMAHPHNSVLQWMSEWGLIAGGIFVALLSWLVIASWRHVRQICARGEFKEALVASGYACSVTAAAIYSLVAGTLVMPIGQLCLVMVLAGLLRRHAQDVNASWPISSLERCVTVAIVPLAAVVLLGFSSLQLAYSQDRGMPCGARLNFPRFWVHSSSTWPYEWVHVLRSMQCSAYDSASTPSGPGNTTSFIPALDTAGRAFQKT
jgi:hypothetical protein